MPAFLNFAFVFLHSCINIFFRFQRLAFLCSCLPNFALCSCLVLLNRKYFTFLSVSHRHITLSPLSSRLRPRSIRHYWLTPYPLADSQLPVCVGEEASGGSLQTRHSKLAAPVWISGFWRIYSQANILLFSSYTMSFNANLPRDQLPTHTPSSSLR